MHTLIDRWSGFAAQQIKPLLIMNCPLFDRLILIFTFAMLSSWLQWWFVGPWLIYGAFILVPVMIQLCRAALLGGKAMIVLDGEIEPRSLLDYLTGKEGNSRHHTET